MSEHRVFRGKFPYSITASGPSGCASDVLRPLAGREGEAWGLGAGGAAGLGKEVVRRAGGMEVLSEPASVRV